MNGQNQTTPQSEISTKELKKEAPLITVHIKHDNIEETLSGNAEEVWLLLSRFFTDLIPSFETAKKLTLVVNLEKLLKDCEGIIGFTDEGFHMLISRNKLTDNETLSLLLLAAYIGRQLGKSQTDALSREELQTRLGKDTKITGTRLSELIKNEIAAKTSDDKYRITPYGIVHLQKEALQKIISKTKA
jgi:hypothetical protein